MLVQTETFVDAVAEVSGKLRKFEQAMLKFLPKFNSKFQRKDLFTDSIRLSSIRLGCITFSSQYHMCFHNKPFSGLEGTQDQGRSKGRQTGDIGKRKKSKNKPSSLVATTDPWEKDQFAINQSEIEVFKGRGHKNTEVPPTNAH